MDTVALQEKITHEVKNQIKDIQEILIAHGVPILPSIIDNLPSYAAEVHTYIKRKAIEDLPPCQFTGNMQINDLSNFVEVGGHLGYRSKNGLFEIRYVTPNEGNVVLEETPEGKFLRSSLIGEPNISYNLLEKSDIILDWHTHPIPSLPSIKDFNSWLRLSQTITGHFEDKPVQFILYLPTIDQMLWFGMQPR